MQTDNTALYISNRTKDLSLSLTGVICLSQWFTCIAQGLSWSYGSWIYNYLCNPCLSPLTLWVWIQLMVRCSRYNIMW